MFLGEFNLMCVPNVLKIDQHLFETCPDDNLPHFIIEFNHPSTVYDGKPVVYDGQVMYEAKVWFKYGKAGHLTSIEVDFIAPCEELDPNEPIPYVVTDLGMQVVELKGKKFHIAPSSPKK